MFLQKFDEYIHSWRWLVYLISLIIIIDCDLFDYNRVVWKIEWIIKITILWLIIIMLRIFFLKMMQKLWKWMYENCAIFIKMRYIFINVPYLLKVILFIFIYIDRILKVIFLLNGYNSNSRYFFIRYLIYCNIMLVLVFPFYIEVLFFTGIYTFINKVASEGKGVLIEFLLRRFHFLIFSLIFMLLFDISRVMFIILIWIIDEFITLYYLWIKKYLDLEKENKRNDYSYLLNKNYNIDKSFYDLDISVIKLIYACDDLILIRSKVIFFNIEESNIYEYLRIGNMFIKIFDVWLLKNYNKILIFNVYVFNRYNEDFIYLYILEKLFNYLNGKSYLYFKNNSKNIINKFFNKFSITRLNFYYDYEFIYNYVYKVFNLLKCNKFMFKDFNALHKHKLLKVENEGKKEIQSALKYINKK